MKTEKIIEKVNSKSLGEYFAIRNARTSSAFKNPMKSCMLLELNENDVVVDIGSYVGEYSIYASQFVRKVISYEASADTFEVLKLNKKPNMEIHNLAVVGGNEDHVELFLSKGIGATNSIVKNTNKAGSNTVKAINFNKAIEGATVIKIDVEGAEYDYQFDFNLKGLRGVILEFHPINGINWEEKANNIMQDLIDAGFNCLLKPNFKNGWDTNSSWVR